MLNGAVFLFFGYPIQFEALDFARFFIVFVEEEAHTFFICPYEWTPERLERMLVMVEIVKMEEEKVESASRASPSMSFIFFLPIPCRKRWRKPSKGALERCGVLGECSETTFFVGGEFC